MVSQVPERDHCTLSTGMSHRYDMVLDVIVMLAQVHRYAAASGAWAHVQRPCLRKAQLLILWRVIGRHKSIRQPACLQEGRSSFLCTSRVIPVCTLIDRRCTGIPMCIRANILQTGLTVSPVVGDLHLDVVGVGALEGVHKGRRAHSALHRVPLNGPAPIPRNLLIQAAGQALWAQV